MQHLFEYDNNLKWIKYDYNLRNYFLFKLLLFFIFLEIDVLSFSELFDE